MPAVLTRRRLIQTAAVLPAAEILCNAGAVNSGVGHETLDLGHRGTRAGPICILPDGSWLWMTTEPEAPYLAKAMWPLSRIALRRSVDGHTWTLPTIVLSGTVNYSLLSHALRVLRNGSLLHIFVRYSGYDYETALPEKSLCEVFAHHSKDCGRSWSEPRKIPTGERYNGDILSIEQLRDGRVIYPSAFLTGNRGQFQASALYSDDQGVTWTRSESRLEAGGGGFESGANEPTVVELRDGRLWMLIRAQTGFLWQSFSKDRGKTWSPASPSNFPASNAPATALRLKGGDIAIAWNNHVHSNYARQSLVLGITGDGKTFRAVREIDFADFPDNPGEPEQHTTYPYLAETKDGAIAISYNKGTWMRHNRPHLALVNPKWLLAREDMVDLRDGRVGWHTVNPGPNRSAAVERYVRSTDERLWLEIEQAPGFTSQTGISRNLPLVSVGQVQILVEFARPEGYLLFGSSLIHPAHTSEAVIRIRFSHGRAFLGAGTPEPVTRNRKSTVYGYLSNVVKSETPYETPLPSGGRADILVRYRASEALAEVRINGGPPFQLRTAKVFGLTSLGLSVGSGGLLRVQSVRTQLA